MSFTDQKPRVATEKDCKAPWQGYNNGKYFRCYLCGHKFKVGDYWRWVFAGPMKGLCNFLVCEECDCDDVADKWEAQNKEFDSEKWWWFREQQQ